MISPSADVETLKDYMRIQRRIQVSAIKNLRKFQMIVFHRIAIRGSRQRLFILIETIPQFIIILGVRAGWIV